MSGENPGRLAQSPPNLRSGESLRPPRLTQPCNGHKVDPGLVQRLPASWSRRLRPKLSFANVVSVLALFVALGGASYAATQLPEDGVGPKQLRKNAVTTAKVKKEAITAAKVKKGTLTGAQINVSTLGIVPAANTADTAGRANSLAAPEGFHEVGAPGEPLFQNSWHSPPRGQQYLRARVSTRIMMGSFTSKERPQTAPIRQSSNCLRASVRRTTSCSRLLCPAPIVRTAWGSYRSTGRDIFLEPKVRSGT